MKKRKWLYGVLLILLVFYVGRVAWVNLSFAKMFPSRQVETGEEFQDGGLWITVLDAERRDAGSDALEVETTIRFRNDTNENIYYPIWMINLAGEWYAAEIEMANWADDHKRERMEYILPGETELTLCYVMDKRFYFAESWPDRMSLPMTLEFVQSEERKSVVLP